MKTEHWLSDPSWEYSIQIGELSDRQLVSRLWNTTSACCLMLKDTYPGSTGSNWCQADTVVHRWISVVRAMPHAQLWCKKCSSSQMLPTERINRSINISILHMNTVWVKHTNSPRSVSSHHCPSLSLIRWSQLYTTFGSSHSHASLGFAQLKLQANFTEVTIFIQK